MHLTLLWAIPPCRRKKFPDLVNRAANSPTVRSPPGCAISSSAACASNLRDEIHAQFEKFRATGLPLDHVNGHLHLHLHPAVLQHPDGQTPSDWAFGALRLTFDPFWLNARLAPGQLVLSGSATRRFSVRLSGARRGPLCAGATSATPAAVFGLLQNARVDEAYVRGLLPRLPAGDSELYSHPSLDEFRDEFDAP